MNQATPLAQDQSTGRLLERLERLRVAVVIVDGQGRPRLHGQAGRLEEVIVQSPQFQTALTQAAGTLRHESGRRVEFWPGTSVVALHTNRRRESPQRQDWPLLALLLSDRLLQGEHLILACTSQGLDSRAIVSQAAEQGLPSDREVERLASLLGWMQQDALEVVRRCGEIQTLSQQLGDSYEELSLVYKFSSNMTVNQQPGAFFESACAELLAVVGLRWLALCLVDHEPRLGMLAGKVFQAGTSPCPASRLHEVGRQFLERPAAAHRPIIEDTHAAEIPGLADLAREMLVIRLERDGRPMGVLLGADKADGSHIGSTDAKLCDALASSLVIFLENFMLFGDMQSMFMGTLHALTSAIDAKDSYTHGHSERVAFLTRALARAAGLDENTTQRAHLAALVHDVGKIGVPEHVLCKPGTLSDEEFRLIKLHPEIGARIIQDIPQMKDLIPGVLYHHERWDGRGYPRGLKGQHIPLLGRIIALADSFDAMSSNRSYRPSMTHDQVLREIHRCSATQFDPDLTEVFMGLDFTGYYQLIEKHQAQERVRKTG